MSARRREASLLAFYGHRISGLVLALFLPAHFYVLALALDHPERFDAFIAFTDHGWVKLMESGLILLLAVHLCFGVRLLLMEFFGWRDPRDLRLRLVTGGALLSIGASALFLVIAL